MYFENRCVYVDGVYSSLSLIRTPFLPNNSVLVRKMSFDEREHRHCICQTVSIIDRDPCIHSIFDLCIYCIEICCLCIHFIQ